MLRKYLLIIICGLTPVVTSRHVQFYRRDYKYVEKFDAFYKMHWDLSGVSWSTAFLACDDEGATLFYPKAQDEWTVAKNLSKGLPEAPNVTDIFVGIHDQFGVGEYITVDGHRTPSPLLSKDPATASFNQCIMMDMETGYYKHDLCARATAAPFVCKKLEDESCPTIDRGYKYVKENKKCYKISKKQKTWHEAMQTCYMEGGILAVIRSEAEANILKTMIQRDGKYFVGFRNMFTNGDSYTVKGKKLEESSYTLWINNIKDNNPGHCGVVHTQNNYYGSGQMFTSTVSCSDRLFFICEIEVNGDDTQ